MNKKVIALALAAVMMLGLLSGCCLSHDWQEATCETPKTCAKCEKTEGEALGHSWQEATCEAPKTCTACGSTEGEALGHEMFWTSEDRRTTMEGTCSVCGKTETEELNWELLGPCNVVDEWTCVDHPEITVTVNADGTAQLVIDGETFELTWEYDSVEETMLGEVVNFWFETPYGREKAVLATIVDNMFIMSIYTQPFTFAR